ncbi:hypothetical protein [Sandaracinobacteroides hominis]|uniref:hypothetical protein n=1 Tax=Sandaracinobacteroides hominis TaxID=2780086 RepID=UPI0018F5998E|nr:hypothetical protein [Sandaracinobacteroides hominis]
MTRLRLILACTTMLSGVVPGAATAAHAQSKSEGAEIKALREKVEALEAQVQALIENQQQVQRSAEQVETKVAEQEKAVAAVPAQVQTALAAQPKPKPQWYDDTKISGRMYWNFSNINNESNGKKLAGSGTGFQIKRFYVGIDHKFDSMFSVNLTTDIDNIVGNNNANLVGKGLYVKKAYVEAKFNPALILRLGAADTPWIPYAESVYGYRHYENTISDRTRFGTSADWGIHLLGSFAGDIVSYQASVVDGGGYRDASVSESLDFEGRVSAKYKGFQAGIGGYSGKLGRDKVGVETLHRATRFNALLAYGNKIMDRPFSVGAEYFRANDWNNVLTAASDSSDGWSVFASVSPVDKISLFGRYDWVSPKKDTAPDFKERYFNVGVQYSPGKIVDFALIYKRDRAENGILSTSNGAIGGTDYGVYDEFGLFGQVRF